MKLSSFENLKDISQGISDNTHGERPTHLGNYINTPDESGIDMFNNAVSQIDTFGDNTVFEARDFEKGEYVYDLKQIISFLPFLKKFHESRMNKYNAVTVDEAMKDEYPGIIPMSGDPQDGNIGINDINIQGDFLPKFHKILKATASKYFSEDEVKKLMKNVIGFIREFDIPYEGSLISMIKSKYDSDETDTAVTKSAIKYDDVQYYVNKAMQKILCGHDSEEIANSYESLAGWATEEITPNSMPSESSDVIDGDKMRVTKTDVLRAVIKEFEVGGVSPEAIDELKKLYCSQD